MTAWRPLLLDLFCCEGGAGEGYRRAGFEVIGVDNVVRNYAPGDFVLGDALDVLAELVLTGAWAGLVPDAVHASPPCHDHSDLSSITGDDGTGELLEQTRDLLRAWGGPYVIENVVGAPMPGALMLCGSEFGLGAECADGRRRQLRRHRLFESNVFLMGAGGCHHRGQPIGVYGTGGGGPMTRGYKGNLHESREAIGAPWMTRAGVSQSIPPAFTQHVGEQLLAAIIEENAA